METTRELTLCNPVPNLYMPFGLGSFVVTYTVSVEIIGMAEEDVLGTGDFSSLSI